MGLRIKYSKPLMHGDFQCRGGRIERRIDRPRPGRVPPAADAKAALSGIPGRGVPFRVQPPEADLSAPQAAEAAASYINPVFDPRQIILDGLHPDGRAEQIDGPTLIQTDRGRVQPRLRLCL